MSEEISDFDLYKKYKNNFIHEDIQKKINFKISKNSSMNIEKLKLINKYEF